METTTLKKPHRSKAQLAAMENKNRARAERASAVYGSKNERSIWCTNPKCGKEFAEKGPATVFGAGVAPVTCYLCGSPLSKRIGV